MKNPLTETVYKNFIGGEWLAAEGNKTLETHNPANGEKLAEIAESSRADVEKAVAAANEAFKTYSQTSIAQRSGLLLKIADIIEENAETLALIETLDNGKPIRETRAIDVAFSVEHFRYFAGVIQGQDGRANELPGNLMSLVLREPIGVVGQIVPWNFPFLMAAWKLAPALAAGDTVVLKPSSTTSLSVLEFMKLIQDVLPKGAVNVITGKGSTAGQYLQESEGIAKLAFTGSTEVGRNIALAAAEKLIPATLELGGKSANIIFEDADFEQVMDGVQLGILFNQGQVCCAGSRIFVQDSIYDKFVEEIVKRFEQVKVGLPWEDDTQMGSQIDERQLKKILDYIEIGKQEGAKVLTGGERNTEGELAKGAFMKPTLLEIDSNDKRVAQEEIFGPVAVIQKFSTVEGVIEKANDSVYGLGGAVFTKDLAKAFHVAKSIRTGRMWVNTYNQIPAGAPFGGYKQSGIGRETDKMILDHYTQTKNIMIKLDYEPSGFYPKN